MQHLCRAFEEVAPEPRCDGSMRTMRSRIETKREMVRKLDALGPMSLETICSVYQPQSLRRGKSIGGE